MSSAGLLQKADLELAMEMQPEEKTKEQLPSPGTMTLDQMEERMIRQCLSHYGGNLSRVAEALGLSRAALYRRLEKYGVAS